MSNYIKGLVFLLLLPFCINAQSSFLVKPYLQVGYEGRTNALELLWHSSDSNAKWSVEISFNGSNWMTSKNISAQKIAVQGTKTFNVYHANLDNLIPGQIFNYRVQQDGKIVFSSEARAPKDSNQAYSFVAIGDIGAEKQDQKKLALIAYNLNPDFVAVPGDIVYDDGLISEYSKKFWSIYNADSSNNNGAPLMRKIPFIAAVGNHDVDNTDLDRHPDALAYYYFWAQPLNGPTITDFASAYPSFKSNEVNKLAFLNAAGNAYPKMNHFSYDYGNAHWLVIDADNYVDWTNQQLLEWVKKDLKNAAHATWRFVMFHQPGFNSSREHFEQQQMRLLAPLFEEGKVDVVFNGHVHNYQRSYPLTFVPDRKGTLLVGGKDNKSLRGRVVNGKWTLDKTFDGVKNKSPKGVIYIVTGAGGADLYNPEQTNDPDSWQKFTSNFFATAHSLSHVRVNGKSFKLDQISSAGKVVDSFEIFKK
jgi:predicted phosphodiesterase